MPLAKNAKSTVRQKSKAKFTIVLQSYLFFFIIRLQFASEKLNVKY